MTKLFIENANKGAGAQVRIYPLDENSQVIAPDSFTSMDDLGLSFGIALQPRPAIECVGVVARSGGIIMEGDGEFSILTDDVDVTAASKNEMLTTLSELGYRVNVLPRWSGAIQCNGGLPVTEWYGGETSTNFEIKVDGESIGYNFYFCSWDSQGNERIQRELLKRGIEIEFVQE